MHVSPNSNQLKAEVAMEYVPGGSLKAILEYFCSFKENLIKVYVQQILNALQSLHSNELVHGDLKLDNIMVDDLGTLKLSDFGFLKRILISTNKYKIYEEWINEKFRTYKHDYMTSGIPMVNSEMSTPPEVVQNPEYKVKSSYDIWCLGMVIYEMLTGEHMFNDIAGSTEGILQYIKSLENELEFPLTVTINCKHFLQA